MLLLSCNRPYYQALAAPRLNQIFGLLGLKFAVPVAASPSITIPRLGIPAVAQGRQRLLRFRPFLPVARDPGMPGTDSLSGPLSGSGPTASQANEEVPGYCSLT